MSQIPPCPYPIGSAIALQDGLSMVVAHNPSPMTFWGTNTYVLGWGTVAIIDPGPDDDAHLAALMSAIGTRKVSHILLTHTHLDHSPLAARLADATGAPILAFGTHLSGRSEVMAQLAAQGLAGGGEGIDADFTYDQAIADGDVIEGAGWALQAIHTPGHIANHLCFVWGDVVFTGDHVMGWASSLVSPPDGDLTQFMASCTRLAQIPARVYYAGHGSPVTDPAGRLAWLVAHRQSREADIRAAMVSGPATVTQLTRQIYTDVPPALLPAAERNVFAHLVDLHQRGVVTADPVLSVEAIYGLEN